MNTRTGHTTMLIDVLDREGYPTDRPAVVVEVWYVTECCTNEFADADGQGVPWQYMDILDIFIPAKTLLGLTSQQVEQILADVKSQLERGQRV